MSPDPLERLQELLDRQDIADSLARFSRGLDRFDRECFLSAFHDDAEVAAGPYVGDAEGCYDWAVPMYDAGQILTHHGLLNSTVEVDGDTAHTETIYFSVSRNRDESIVLAGGRYLDRFARRNGTWGIVVHINVLEWCSVVPGIPPTFGNDDPGIADNGLSARDDSDPSYRRPLLNRRTASNPTARG